MLRGLGVAILCSYLLYVVAMNGVLKTSLLSSVLEDAIGLRVTYDHAWSLLPGRIHAQHLSIRGSDSNVEWLLTIERIAFDVHLLKLTGKTFDVSRADGDGLTMRIRQKLRRAPDDIEETSRLPPIDGFPAYSVRPAGPASLERWSDAHYHLWTVHLADVVAENVREIWFDEGRFTGNARIEGGFFLKPIRRAQVGPCHVLVREGHVTYGPHEPLATRVAGTVDLEMTPFDPRADESVLRHLNLRTDVEGALVARPLLGVDLEGDPALELKLAVDRGVIGPSHLRGHVDRGRAAISNHIGRAAVDLVADVDDRLHATLTVSDATIERGDATVLAAATQIVMKADSARRDLADQPLSDAHVVVDAPDLFFRDARGLNGYLPSSSKIAVASGSARASAHLEASGPDPVLQGHVAVLSDALGLRIGELRVDAAVDARARVHDVRLDGDSLAVDDASLLLTNVEVRHGAVHGVSLAAIRARASSPSFTFTDPLREGVIDLGFERGVIHDGKALDVAMPRGTTYGIVGEEARVSGDIHLVVRDHVAHGRASGIARGVGFRTDELRLVGDTDATLDLRAWNLAAGTVTLGPSRIVVRDAKGDFRRDGRDDPQAFATKIEATGSAALDLARPTLDGVEGRLVVDRARVPELGRLGLPITRGAATASLDVTLGKAGTRGNVSLDVKQAAMRVKTTDLTGDVGVRAELRSQGKDVLDLRGAHVLLREIAVGRAQHWDADLVVKDGLLRLGAPSLDAVVRVDADDARPILGLLDVPKIVRGMATMPHLAAYARIRAREGMVWVSDVEASGGDVAVHGAYAVTDAEPRGAFVVEKGPVSVGVRIEDGVHPHLFDLKDWLRDQTLAVESKAKKREASPP